MSKLFANPTVRLAGRALVAAAIVAITQVHNSNGGQIAWMSVATGAGLAFCEIFTPLNSLVGVFKGNGPYFSTGAKPTVKTVKK